MIEFDTVIANSKRMLTQLRDAVVQVENDFSTGSEAEKIQEIFKRADMINFSGNPLVARSIEACRRIL